MAKSKHSPALFEVVHGKRRFDRSAGVLSTPNWWFKGRHRGPAVPVDPVDPPTFTDEEAEADPTLRGLPSPTQSQTQTQSHTQIERDPEPQPAEYESAVSNHREPLVMPHPRRGTGAFQFVVDHDRQELYFRVRYTAAIVAGFALMVIVALAYMGGRHLGRGPSSALASASSEEVAAGPIEKGVLDVGTHSGAGVINPPSQGLGAGGVSAQPAPPPSRIAEASIVPPQAAPTAARSPGPSAPSKATPAGFENGRRIVGWQYVVIQAYAGDQMKLAEEARDFLIKNGVNCTIEKGVAGWPATWHSVVSTQGFERASGPSYDAFIGNAQKLGISFAGKSAWKRFEPTPVRWKESN